MLPFSLFSFSWRQTDALIAERIANNQANVTTRDDQPSGTKNIARPNSTARKKTGKSEISHRTFEFVGILILLVVRIVAPEELAEPHEDRKYYNRYSNA